MTRSLHDGRQDGLEPLESLDIRGAEGLADLLERMARTAFGGRELGEAFEVLRAMADDPDCTRVVTVSGAMTVGKMGRVLCEMIDAGLAQIIVCTGAVMAHGLSEAIGCTHYKHDPRARRQAALRLGLQSRLRHAGNGGQFLARPGVGQRGARRLGLVAAGLFLADQPGVGPQAGGKGADAQHPGLRLPPRRAGLCPGHDRFGTGPGRGHLLPRPGISPRRRGRPGGVLLPRAVVQSVPGPLRLRPADTARRAAGHLHRRRRRAPQLGPAGRPLQRHHQHAAGDQAAGAALPLRRADLPGARPLGRPERLHLHRRGLLGQVSQRRGGGRFAEVHCDATIAWPLLVKAVLEEGGGRRAEGGGTG